MQHRVVSCQRLILKETEVLEEVFQPCRTISVGLKKCRKSVQVSTVTSYFKGQGLRGGEEGLVFLLTLVCLLVITWTS